MKWFVSVAQLLRARLADLRHWAASKARRRAPRVGYQRVDEFPDLLKPSILYVAGEESHIWAAAMRCPCGCGDVIELNLLKEASPCWSVSRHPDGSVSLRPSIWRQKACRSHFFVRHGRIEWCRTPRST